MRRDLNARGAGHDGDSYARAHVQSLDRLQRITTENEVSRCIALSRSSFPGGQRARSI
jgi:hypothetical protein